MTDPLLLLAVTPESGVTHCPAARTAAPTWWKMPVMTTSHESTLYTSRNRWSWRHTTPSSACTVQQARPRRDWASAGGAGGQAGRRAGGQRPGNAGPGGTIAIICLASAGVVGRARLGRWAGKSRQMLLGSARKQRHVRFMALHCPQHAEATQVCHRKEARLEVRGAHLHVAPGRHCRVCRV